MIAHHYESLHFLSVVLLAFSPGPCLRSHLGHARWMTTEEDLRNGCAVAYRKADAILCGEPRDSNGLNRDQIAAVRS